MTITTLYVLVEGQTEEGFVSSVLEPHLRRQGFWVHPVVVETSRDASGRKHRGGGDWKKWFRDIKRLTRHKGSDVFFTTMFDLYGLPQNYPKLQEHAGEKDSSRRAELLERAMAEEVMDWRLVPYLQRHEFEALVFAGLSALEDLLGDPADLEGLEILKKTVAHKPPEDINDGRTTAPSKRLQTHIPGYHKAVHGPLVVSGAGLDQLRRQCPRFSAWLSKLEELRGKHATRSAELDR